MPKTVSTYNMVNYAIGMADFIKTQTEYNTEYKNPVVYVTDVDGRHVTKACFEEVVLTDGSKVYNLVLEFEP